MQARSTSFSHKALSVLVAIVMTFSLTPTFTSTAYATDLNAAQSQDANAQGAAVSADEASDANTTAQDAQSAPAASTADAQDSAKATASDEAALATVENDAEAQVDAEEMDASEVTGGSAIDASGTYQVKADATGTITIAEGIAVKLIGQGIGTANDNEATAYKNLRIVVKEGSELTLSGMRIHNAAASSDDIVDAIDFEGQGTLATEGDNLIDLDGGTAKIYSASAAIHVGPAANVTFKGTGNLYVYKWSGGAAIGGHGGESDGETCGSMTFKSGTWLLAGNKLGPVIGGDSQSVKNQDITIEGGAIYATSIAMGACIGSSASGIAGDVTVSGGSLELWSDWGGSSIGRGGNGNESNVGTLTVTGGSIKSIVGPNAFPMWGVISETEKPVVTNANITAKTTDADGKDVAMLTFDASAYQGQSIDVTVDGKQYYSGSLYQYSTAPAYSHTATYTPLRWTKSEQPNLYLQLSKENHVIKVGGDTYTYAWDASAQTFKDTTPETDISWYNTTDNSFTLSTPAELAGFAAIVNGKAKSTDPKTGETTAIKDAFEGKTITLGASIDLSAYSWSPIGGKDNPFKGIFDGRGRTISGLSVDTTEGYAGLFGNVAKSGVVENLSVAGTVASSTSDDYAGGIAGYNSGIITNVKSSVTVSAPSAFNVGGIAGFNDGGYNAEVSTTEATGGEGAIDMCAVTANVTGSKKVGGIVGENSGTISQSYATATVDGTDAGGKNGVGGIAGRNGNNNTALEAGDIESCYFTGTVGRSGQKWVGGITGFNNAKSSIENSYMAGTLVAGAGYYNAIAGNQEGPLKCSNNYSLDTIKSKGITEAETGIAKTEAEFKAADMIPLLNKLGAVYTTDDNSVNNGFPVFAWTNRKDIDAAWYDASATSYTLKNATELQEFAAIVNGTAANIGQDSFLGKTVTLADDIDFGNAIISPVGNEENPFAGTFDGEGHAISNINIAQGSTGYAGLFGNIEKRGVVKNFTAAGKVAAEGGDYVGGIAGYNAGTISDVESTIAVSAPASYNVGGIAGFNDGGYNVGISIEATGGAGTIAKCTTAGSVTGNGKVGGIAGENSGAIKLSSSSATVDGVNAGSKNGVGGIVGRNGNNNIALEAGTIDSCYFMGTVGRSGQKWVGGITGFNNAKSTATNCYMAGTLVEGKGTYNAVIGQNEGTSTNNYALDTIKGSGTEQTETGVAKSEADFKTYAMVKLLGTANYGMDTNSINNGFPVFSFNSDAAIKGNEIAGETRIETAIEAAKTAYPAGTEGVIIATSSNFPDALSASSLAGALDYPILLADPNQASDDLLAAISDLGAKQAIVIGGKSVISEDCYLAISKVVNGNSERIFGDTRYDTQVKIYHYGATRNLWEGDPIIATGENFADALSISSYAAAKKSPIFLVNQNGAFTGTQASYLLSDYKDAERIIIVGGEAVVPKSVSDWLSRSVGAKNVTRLFGDTRYTTCAEIADFCFDEGMSTETVGIATGQNYADALVAGPALAKKNGVLLIASGNDSDSYAYHADLNATAIKAVAKRIAAADSGLYKLDFFGGHEQTSPLPQGWRDEQLKLLNDIREGNATN